MRLTAEEEAILAGRWGEPTRRALEMQIAVGEFFGAERMVRVTSAHLTGDPESMGDAGLAFVEQLVRQGARFVVPTTTNSCNVDFALYRQFGQPEEVAQKERRLRELIQAMGGILLTSCTNYQTIYQPRFGEHLAWGDTGTVIYANAVCGARSNFEGGPASYAGALTGRVPAYGMHLDECRWGTHLVEVRDQPTSVSDWGALGVFVGRRLTNYWLVPVFAGLEVEPDSDALKQLGATLASYGSLAMFHVVGGTPEARTVEAAFGGRQPRATIVVEPGNLNLTYRSFAPEKEKVDLVVFGTPHLSIFEVRRLAGLLEGKKVHPNTMLLLTTNAQVKAMADQFGYTEVIEAAGGRIVVGVCYYIMTPREMARRHGLRAIVTDSAKLANIIAAYGYNPIFRPTAECVEAAVTGRIAR
ncbi:MAG: aconitase X catalytic domain-containing protein [Candidatus Rokubacteria bacterium]|nr:aconitase X catalytic domain-containing protein [Candidatus Rokubacteria bacterium]